MAKAMTVSKHPLASKVVWGLLVALVGTVLGWSVELQGDILQYSDEILQLIGGLLALYGRLKAQTKLDFKAPLKGYKLPDTKYKNKIPLLFVALLIPVGCASADTSGAIDIGELSRDLYIVDIGSNSQMPVNGGTAADVSTRLPVSGVPVPVDFDFKRSGLLSGQSLRIDKVGGSIIIQRAFVGTQNVPLQKTLPKLFLPSIDPLGSINTTIEITEEITEE